MITTKSCFLRARVVVNRKSFNPSVQFKTSLGNLISNNFNLCETVARDCWVISLFVSLLEKITVFLHHLFLSFIMMTKNPGYFTETLALHSADRRFEKLLQNTPRQT